MKEECISCRSTDSLIEAGGQFCGGTWWLCQRCDDKSNSFFRVHKVWCIHGAIEENNKGGEMKVTQTKEAV